MGDGLSERVPGSAEARKWRGTGLEVPVLKGKPAAYPYLSVMVCVAAL